MWERNFEVMFGIFSVSQSYSDVYLKVIQMSICFKISYDQKCENCDHTFRISNFKTDRYLNNFQEHLFGILRLRKYQTSLQNFFPT